MRTNGEGTMTKRDLIQELLRDGDLDDSVVVETSDGRQIGVTGIETLRESRLRVAGVVGLKLYREVSTVIPVESEVS